MLKPSPLKHREGHSMLTQEAHKEAHGGEITEDLPLQKDLTIFNTDSPKPPENIEQAEVEKKSTDAKLENNINESFFPNQIEPSVQDNTINIQPIHLTDPTGEDLKEEFWGDTNRDDYKRKNNKWYRVDGDEEIEVGADPKTRSKKQTALLNHLNQTLWGGGKEIDPNDPQTWIEKNNKTIAAGLRKSNTHPGIIARDEANNSITIKLPNGKVFNVNADDPESLKKYKEINNFYNTKPPVGKDKDLLTSLQFNDDKEFNKAWGSAGYSMTGYGEKQVLKGPDGKEIDLSDIQSELQEGFDGGQFGRASIFDAARKYLHDNATSKDIAAIKKASIAETTKSIEDADVKRKALNVDVDGEGFASYVSSGSFKNEMIFSLTGQQKEGTFDPNKPSTWGNDDEGGIVEGTGVSQSTLDMIDAYYDKNLDINGDRAGKLLKNGSKLTDLKPIIQKLQAIPKDSEGYEQAQADIKVMQNLLPQLDKTLKSGALKAKNEIIDGQLETYQAQQFRENKGQILASMGAEYMEEQSLTGTSEDPENQSKMQLDLATDKMFGDYDSKIEKFETVIKSTAEDAAKDGVSVKYDGINFMVDGDDPEKVAFYKKQFSNLNKSMIKAGEDFSQTNADYKEKYKEWQNKHGKILDIENQSSREHDLFNINVSKFGDGFRSMGYSALSLVDERAAISKKQAMETGAIGLEKPFDYRTALKTRQKWRFVTGELATQGPNAIVAIASGGIGMGMGLGTVGTTMLTGYGVFGTYSGTQKYMDLTIQQQAGEEAKKGLANLEKFKFMYEPEDYMRTKMQYEKAIAFGDIDADQKRAAAFTSFAVEGTVMSLMSGVGLGTLPNSLNLIKKFANPGAGIGNKLLRSNLKAAGAAAGQTAKGITGEIIEETSIEALTTIGDGLILSRDMDFSHLDDVAVTSIISSGPMTAVPNTYAAIVKQTQTAEYRKEVNSRLNKMNEIEKKFATLGKIMVDNPKYNPNKPEGKGNEKQIEVEDPMREIYVDQYKAEVEAIAGEHTKLEVDALALGADNAQKLVKAAVEENYLNQQAGVTSKDNNKTIELKRKAYKESLSKSDATNYQDRLNAINDQRNKIVESVDYDGATERIFGDKGKYWDNKLKNNPEYKKADKRGKLAIILDKVRKDKVNSNITKAKNDPRAKKFVEQHIYGEGGFEGSGRKNRKAAQENAIYEDMASGLLVNQRNANIAATEGNTNAATLLGNDRLKKLRIVEAKDTEAMNDAIYNNEGLTEEAKQGMVNSLKSGEAKGVIIDNQYIVLDKEGAQKNLDNGDLLQGTVLSHEISHFVDDASFENENEKAIYTHNLNGLISKTSPVIHELALDRTNGITDAEGKPLYDESKSFEEQSIDYKDEYTKSVQDMLMDPAFEREYQDIKNKSGVGVINRVRMALNKDFAADINTEKSAGAWMVGFIDNFKEGNLSPLAKRKIDATNNKGRKGIKFSREASEKVQSIYEEQGVGGAFDIIDQFKPIVSKIVERRSEAPSFDRQLLTDEIETGKRGIYDLIQEYNPDMGVPLAAYINKYLPSRAIEASQRVLGEEFTEDITERGDLFIEEEIAQEPTQFKRKKIILSDRLNVKKKVDKAIKAKLPNLDVANLNFKTLKDQTPEITGEMFGISPKKLISGANITKGELQSAQMFISKNADVLLAMLPEGATTGGTATGVPKTLLKPFYTKTDRAKMAKTGTKAGLAVQVKKPNISKAEFLEVFGIVDGVPNRTDRNTSARVLALANQTGKMMTNQAVRQELLNQGQPLQSMGYLADGKSTVMFSMQGGQKTTQVVGNMDRALSLEDRVLFWDDISAFANENILDRNLESIKIGLRNVYGHVPGINGKINELAVAIHETIKNVKDPILKNPIKLTEKLLETNNKQLTKVASFFNSNTTAAAAFRDPQRVKNLVATTSVLSNKLFDSKNPGKSIAKILMMKGHLASSSRNSHLDRKQPLPGNPEFLNATLGSIPGVEFKTKKSKDGKISLDKNSITYNGKPVKLETVTSAQSSKSALNDARDKVKLSERSKAEDVAQELLNETLDFYTELYNNGEIDNIDLQMVSASLLSNMDAVLARAAKLKYASDNAYDFKNPGQEVKYEHMQPRVAVLLNMWDAKINGDGISDVKDFLKNYTIQVIPNTMDKVITESKLGESLYVGQTLEMPSWIRTYNETTKENDKGRLRPLIDVYTKEVLKPSEAIVKGLRILKPNAKQNQMLSKAVNFSRSVNPAKGITVLDFDDTLATTKSGVRAKIPNADGLPKPKRKVIFLAGGAGSGKGNVISKLGLEDQGFKVVNSDISLEWLKKNNGLPENMNDFTKEQRSRLGSLQHQARGIAKRKMMKYQGNADGVVVDGTGGSIKSMEKLVNEFKDKGYDVSMMFVETSLPVALERNAARKERSLLDKIVEKNHESVQGNKDGFKTMFGDRFMEVNTDNLSQQDAMPAKLTEQMNDFVSGYENRRLDAEEFASEGADILEQGGTFDFSEFNKVVEGQKAPLFEKAMKLQDKFGNKDMFVLTARPAESAPAIFEFLQANGLNIPLENITGLANSTPEAKALWIAEKVGDGYNDFYFADDALQNVQAVQNMLDQFDVKSKVQQAKVDFVHGDPQVVKLVEESSKNDVKDVDRLTKPGTYNNIKFSKSHRGEYENTIAKNRPDLVKEGLVSKTVDNMFNFIDNLNVAADKKRKYEKITTKWLATSNVKLGEDSYKIQQAVELAEKNKEDIFSYRNPNEIIEKYAGKTKAKPTNPKSVKEFGEGRVFNKKHGITVHEVEDTWEGMMSVRKVADTHWGPKSNPWCIIARSEKQRVEPRQHGYESVATESEAQARKQQLESEGFVVEIRAHKKDYRGKYPGKSIDGKRVDMRYELDIKEVKEGPGIMDDAWQNWTIYEKSRKYIVFQNGRLSSFYANDQYWDRMDNPTDAPVVQIKEGNVTKKVELVPYTTKKGESKVQEFVMETRTVSKDKKTVTTEYHVTKDLGEDTVVEGDYKVEDRVNGITVKETEYNPEGDVYRVTDLKGGKAVETRTFYKGKTQSINNGKELSVEKHGDLIAHELTDGNIDYWYGKVLINEAVTAIGFKTPTGFDVVDVTKRVNGKIRVDLKKVLEVDPDAKGLPKSNIKFSKSMNQNFNDILEGSTGVESIKEFSDAQARLRGQKTKYKSIIPASAQDFQGLLYSFLGKGKQGEADMAFFKKALIDPFARGINELNASRQAAANDFENLNKKFPDTKKILNEKVDDVYTVDQAIRVYLWNKAGFEVPGLSKRDSKMLVDFVQSDVQTQAYADAIGLISKKENGYSKPKDYWLAESIASDLLSDGAIGDVRADLLAEWIQNKNIIFSKENLNKIEAIYGSKFREALEDMLYRMETGRNRPVGGSRLVNGYMNWVNNSVGAIMFLNLRSATLQTISATNYVNWTDNNPAKAAAAFANQPQFWSDFSMIWNSPYLKQRRSGNQRGINEAELSEAIAGSDNKAKAALAWLLKKGFTPTQLADSFAISMGGATFLRNRIKKYVKEGMSQKDAEAKAWIDFQETTEVNQQSARPDMISQQQASPLGRLILAFQNTPMQYARIMNKATRDLTNGRGDYKTHISKIAYYGFVQSVIFGALQSALYASLGDDDEEDFDKKKERILNQMVDSWLTGIGVGGKAIGTVKNTIMEYLEQRDKGFNSDHAYTLLTLLSFSPPIGSKLRKIYSSIKTEEFNRGVFEKRGFTLDNPIWSGVGNVIEGVTNAPLGRMANLMLQLDNAMDSSHEWWQRVALILGQNTWDLGIKDPDIEAIKSEIKEEKKEASKIKAKEKKEQKKKETEEANKAVIEENKKKSKKDGICSAISKGGKRCKSKAVNGGMCTVHEKAEQNETGTKSQCKKIKKGGKRCGMQTSNKSGYCYYHD